MNTPMPVAAAVVTNERPNYVDWPAILAGAVLASAISFLLSAFGSALGLSLISPYRGEGMPSAWAVIALGLWVLWVAGTSFMTGAYVTGRLRRRVGDATEHEVAIRDGVHGAIVWAVATLVGATLLIAGAYAGTNVAARAAGAAAGAAAASGNQPGSIYSMVAERLYVGADEQAKPGGEAARTVAARLIGESAAAGRKLGDTDRAFLAKMIAARAGIDEAAALQRVDAAQQQAAEIAAKAKQTADAARKVGIVFAFGIAASLLIGLVGAYWAAGMGGQHRDKETVHDWLRWR